MDWVLCTGCKKMYRVLKRRAVVELKPSAFIRIELGDCVRQIDISVSIFA
jgi:hypothetical protein